MQDLGGLPCDDKPTKGSTSSFSLVVACLSVSCCNTFVEFIWKWKWTGVGFSCFSWTTLRFLEGSVPPGPLPSSYSLPLPICIRSVLILFQCLYLDHCNPKNYCLIFVNIMKSCLSVIYNDHICLVRTPVLQGYRKTNTKSLSIEPPGKDSVWEEDSDERACFGQCSLNTVHLLFRICLSIHWNP